MTAPAVTVPASPTKRGRRWWYLGVTVLVAVVVGAVVLITSRQSIHNGWLDPGNPRPEGAAALAAVIDSHGADVRVIRSGRGLERAGVDANTTVVVSSIIDVGDKWAPRLLAAVREAHRLVLIDPTSPQLGSLNLPVGTTQATGVRDTVPARCSTEFVSPTDTVSVAKNGFRPFRLDSAVECFIDGEAAQLVVLPRSAEHPETVVLTGDLLRNDTITRVDNAGVAIRTLAPTDKVVWYVPDWTDTLTDGSDVSSGDDIPVAVRPLVLLAGFGLLAAMLWRGRRFGALVTEPLPVVVKSDETTRARGRLYHRSRAITRSAAALRVHTLQKISVTVGLPYDPRSAGPVDAIVDAASAASGWDPSQIHPLLAGPLPVDDDGLVLFARALSDLEKEVRFTP